ncbi:hypothetical protein [Moorena sp. SIO4G3]|uniref:hypothetical protein n=1 Tax=Moorena sp. SIO4G3 TaxID=2607821 RepID=UPI0025D901B6|nr:hypothetical protein [Moorena sp. SIO4G3]
MTEYGEAVEFYAERRVELAQAFINVVEDAIFRIVASPTRWAVLDEDIRRCLTGKLGASHFRCLGGALRDELS